jgi:RNA polymerase sigma-70 factor, ECF subfamily
MRCEAQLKEIGKGDRQAFNVLYREWHRPMTSYASGMLAGDRSAAEDVVNEAFIAIWTQAGNFSGSGSAAGWMRRIVRNKAVDWIRKQRETPMTDDLATVTRAGQADESQSPFDDAADASTARNLRTALGNLSFEQREAVWLCYYEEMSIAEIAAIAGCPQNTVKTRLFSARRVLRTTGMLDAY